MADQWQYWRDELANPGVHSRDEDRNISGYYRLNGAKTKPSYPVAIWKKDGSEITIFQIGRQRPKDSESNSTEWYEFIGAGWTKCVAVTRDEWNKALETGFWSDGKHSHQMSDAEKMGIDVEPGGNNAPIDESLADQIRALAEKINKTPEPVTQEQANDLTGDLDKMRALLKIAEANRTTEKQPHLDACRDVDNKWKAIGEPGGNAYRSGEEKRKAYLKKVQAKLDADAAAERKRQQDEINAENERIREDNRKRAEEAAAAGQDAPAPEPEREIAAPPVEAPRATAGSAFGRSSGLKKITVVAAVDNAVLAKHFIDGADEDFSNYLMDRARKALRAKITLPGTTTREDYQ